MDPYVVYSRWLYAADEISAVMDAARLQNWMSWGGPMPCSAVDLYEFKAWCRCYAEKIAGAQEKL